MFHKTELSTCVVVYENAFKPGDFVQLLEQECQTHFGYLSWYMSRVGVRDNQRVAQDYRSSLLCDLAPLSLPIEEISEPRLIPAANAWKKIHESVQKVVWDYRNSYNIEVQQDEGFSVNKYGRGAQYKGHVDHAPQNERVFSMVAFLNDNFDGGELCFPLLDLEIKPKAGSVVMFPSNFPYFHYANAVGLEDQSHVKYSLVTWFR